MDEIKLTDVGYTILVGDCLILCGTGQHTYFKPLAQIINSKHKIMIRHYQSKKILLSNLGSHLKYPKIGDVLYKPDYKKYFDELNQVLLDNGYISKGYGSNYIPHPLFDAKAIQFLIDQGYLKVIKLSQNLKLEEN